MSDQWFYYQNNKQEGPVGLAQLRELLEKNIINSNTYIWTKGFQDWKLLKDVTELSLDGSKSNSKIEKKELIEKKENTATLADDLLTSNSVVQQTSKLFLNNLKPDEKCIYIKTGFDRGGTPKEYGPYDLVMVKKLYQANRINGRTLVYFPGIDCWRVLAIFSDFEEVFEELPPIVQESDRRRWERKPFTARLFFTTDNQFYEGVCKDLSLGGMLVLLHKFPGKVGDIIKMNVHPDNSEFHFVAKARIVRISKTDGAISMEFVDLNDTAKKTIQSYLS